MPRRDLDLETYVALVVALSDPGSERESVLAQHGFDADEWEAIDEGWQARLDEAMESDESEGVPPLVEAYANEFARVQQMRAADCVSFETYVEAAHAIQRGEPVADVLQRLGMALDRYLKSHQHWTAEMTRDRKLLARFRG